jgi:hypothetical protein
MRPRCTFDLLGSSDGNDLPTAESLEAEVLMRRGGRGRPAAAQFLLDEHIPLDDRFEVAIRILQLNHTVARTLH